MASEHIVESSDAGFEQDVLKSEIPVLVDFWAPWCAPCRMIAPDLEAIAEKHKERIRVVKINVDENPKAAQTYGIQAIPTLMLFKGGEVKDTAVGVVPKDKIESLLASNIENA